MNKLKEIISFLVMKLKWKKLNKYNNTWPGRYFDINKVKIGKNTYGKINAITYPCENSYLKIGNYCSISSSTLFVLGGEHNTNTISTFPFKEKILHDEVDTFSKGEIVLEDDVWTGEKSIILSGVHIGQGAIVAAGAVVTKNVPPYAVVGGVPARIMKYRFDKEIIDELLKIDYSKLTNEDIKKHVDELYNSLKDKKQLDWMIKR